MRLVKIIFSVICGAGFIASLGILGTLDTMSNQADNEYEFFIMLGIAFIAIIVGFIGMYFTEQKEIKSEYKTQVHSHTKHSNNKVA